MNKHSSREVPKGIKTKSGFFVDRYNLLFVRQLTDSVNKVVSKHKKLFPYPESFSRTRYLKKEREVFSISMHLLTSFYSHYFSLPACRKVTHLHLSSNSYSGYGRSWRVTYEVFQTLCEMDLIHFKLGEHKKSATKIWITKKLESLFKQIGLVWISQDPNNLVLLRDRKYPDSKDPKKLKKKINLPLPDSAQIRRHEENLLKINSFLSQHCYSLNLGDQQIGELLTYMVQSSNDKNKSKSADEYDTEKSAYLNLNDYQLKRIFSRGSLEKGGRFYGGWWQALPSQFRPFILIDGKKTAEVDYSGVAINIIYAMLDKPFDFKSDPYEIGLPDWQGKNDSRRRIIKEFLNAIINDDGHLYALNKQEERELELTSNELLELITERHGGISEAFNNGIGLDTQFVDSIIAERVMLRMKEEGHVVLPIHDSFVVRLDYEYRLKEIMLEEFEGFVGRKIRLKSDGPITPDLFSTAKKRDLSAQQDDESFGVINLCNIKFDKLFADSLMKDFGGSFQSH